MRSVRRGAMAAVLATGVVAALPWGVATGQSSGPSAVPSAAGPSAVPSALPSALPSGSPVPSATPAPPPVVRLVDAGARPRAVRRYRFTAGTTGTMVMELSQGVRTVIGSGAETAFELPTIRYTMDVAIPSVDPAGVATLVMTLAAV